MTRSRRTLRSSTGRPRGRRGGRGRRALALGATLLVALALGFGMWRWQGGDGGVPRAAGDARAIARQARAAELAGDDPAALALYRAGLARYPRDEVLLGSYATATTNRSFAVRRNRGRIVPVAPTSRDRVDAAREALALLDAAQAADARGGQPALMKGLLYAAWGLPEDALVELYVAVTRGERAPQLERTAGAITLLQLGRADSLGTAPDQNGRPASR